MFYEHKQKFFSNLIFDKRTQKQRIAIDTKLPLSKTYFSKIKILRIFALPFIFIPIELSHKDFPFNLIFISPMKTWYYS